MSCHETEPLRLISIHALLAESDHFSRGVRVFRGYFYPRSPCGERHFQFSPYPPLCEFLSTLSLRRATKVAVGVVLHGGISIHALLAESDIQNGTRDIIENQFLSTLSLRRATHPYRHLAVRNQISIHALLAESDPATLIPAP